MADAKLLRCCMLVVVLKAAIIRSIQLIFSLATKPTMSCERCTNFAAFMKNVPENVIKRLVNLALCKLNKGVSTHFSLPSLS